MWASILTATVARRLPVLLRTTDDFVKEHS